MGTLGPSLGGCDDQQDTPGREARHEQKGGSETPSPEEAAPNDEQRARTYTRIRDRLEDDPKAVAGPGFPQTRAELREIANTAEDAHLRANAALLLGAIHESRSERDKAIDLYRHATKLVSDDAGPYMALALALAASKRYQEAVTAQEKATELDPDNLENWLALAEMRLEAGDDKGGAQAYVDYERRRKGLIDGLTLTKDGNHLVSIEQRIGCAEALASTADVGTAVALLYALETEPEARVREAIVRAMGIQRLEGYAHRLKKNLEQEKDAQVRQAIAWALGEIERDPVKAEPPPTKPGKGKKNEAIGDDRATDASDGGAEHGASPARE